MRFNCNFFNCKILLYVESILETTKTISIIYDLIVINQFLTVINNLGIIITSFSYFRITKV